MPPPPRPAAPRPDPGAGVATAGAAGATVRACDLGLVDYDEALALQSRLAAARKDGRLERDILLILEHPPVITHGRAASGDGHVLAAAGALAASGIRRVEIDRGGDVTYHGPGQLVGYPIFDLAGHRRDLHWYLRRLEESLIRAVSGLGLAAARAEGLTGVWVGEGLEDRDVGLDASLPAGDAATLVRDGSIRKIASIGIHASRWVTTHGFALNRAAEALEGFRWIVPCGIDGVTVTSLESEGIAIPAEDLRDRVIRGVEEAFSTGIALGDLPRV